MSTANNALLYFNPTMVRLLLAASAIIVPPIDRFQSHNGAIAARFQWETFPLLLAEFQSHNGAIAAAGDDSPFVVEQISIPQWCDCCLSSMLEIHALSDPFQSHNGAIAAMKLWGWWKTQFHFNPTMVRLLLKQNFCQEFNRSISIPQWCDCCQSHHHNRETRRVLISIPQWCDCCFLTRSDTPVPSPQHFNPTMVRLLP